jgi:rfaE bifunctional protein kinase chain/domain
MTKNLKELFAGKRVLIAGDIMLDSYIFGSVDRISPEAPVPVVAIENRENRPGGAANVAVNIQALGAIPLLCAVIGSDEEADMMREILVKNNVDTDYLFVSQNRKTTAKLRIMAQKHQLLRLDYEQTDDLNSNDQALFITAFKNALQQADVVILEDYNKGLLTAETIPQLILLAKQHNIPVCVDPKKNNFWSYKGVDLFKPNSKELKEALQSTVDLKDEQNFLDAIHELETRLENKISFVTLSERGVFIKENTMHYFLPAFVRSIADVSGAGDTVISVAALCLANNMPIKQIAVLANLAGGLVCEEPGVVPISIDKLQAEADKISQQYYETV